MRNQNDFLVNLAAGFTQVLLTNIGNILKDKTFGNAEQRSLQVAWETAFLEMLEETAAHLPDNEKHLLEEIFKKFLEDEEVATLLLDLAINGETPPRKKMRKAFKRAGFQRKRLNIDFDKAMLVLTQELSSSLINEAKNDGSPLHNRVNLTKLERLHEDHTKFEKKFDKEIRLLTELYKSAESSTDRIANEELGYLELRQFKQDVFTAQHELVKAIRLVADGSNALRSPGYSNLILNALYAYSEGGEGDIIHAIDLAEFVVDNQNKLRVDTNIDLQTRLEFSSHNLVAICVPNTSIIESPKVEKAKLRESNWFVETLNECRQLNLYTRVFCFWALVEARNSDHDQLLATANRILDELNMCDGVVMVNRKPSTYATAYALMGLTRYAIQDDRLDKKGFSRSIEALKAMWIPNNGFHELHDGDYCNRITTALSVISLLFAGQSSAEKEIAGSVHWLTRLLKEGNLIENQHPVQEKGKILKPEVLIKAYMLIALRLWSDSFNCNNLAEIPCTIRVASGYKGLQL